MCTLPVGSSLASAGGPRARQQGRCRCLEPAPRSFPSRVILRVMGRTGVFFFEILVVYFSGEGEGGRERERNTMCERNVASHTPPPETWPPTQACALTRNRTQDLSVRRPAPNPESHQAGQKNVTHLLKSISSFIIIFMI